MHQHSGIRTTDEQWGRNREIWLKLVQQFYITHQFLCANSNSICRFTVTQRTSRSSIHNPKSLLHWSCCQNDL